MPFGPDCEYDDFAACLRANADKDDPEAYCGKLQADTEDHCKTKGAQPRSGMADKGHLFADYKGFKALEDGNGGFEGHGAVFNNLDDGGDIIRPGAFAQNLDFFVKSGWIAFGHDWGVPEIGMVKEAREDDRGLWISTLYHETEAAQTARRIAKARLDAGKTVGLSIGYDVNPGGAIITEVGGQPVRELLSLKTYEVSQVNAPMNVLAGIAAAKGITMPEQQQLAQVSLAGLSAYIARVKSLAGLREAEGRTLSEEHRTKLTGLVAEMTALHSEAQTLLETGKSDGGPDNRALYNEFLRVQASLNGVR